MDYRDALEATGAVVLACDRFGSYQGDLLAKIEYQGEIRFIRSYYGSCSGCDSFQGEFGYDCDGCWEHPYSPVDDCLGCASQKQMVAKRLAEFGVRMIDSYERDYRDLLTEFEKDSEWDSGAGDVLKWLSANK